MSTNPHTIKTLSILTISAMLALAGTARAETTTLVQDENAGRSVTVTQNENDRKVSVRMVNGEVVSAEVNGKAVSKDKVTVMGDRLMINLDGQAPVTLKFRNPDTDVLILSDLPVSRLGSTPDTVRLAQAAMADLTPPKSMIGITMVVPSPELAGHLGLSEGQGVMITGVSETLPAGKAGLRQYDVVLKINDQPASEESIRSALRDAEPGSTIAMDVISRGERRTLKLTTIAFDQTQAAVTQNLGQASLLRGQAQTFTVPMPEELPGMSQQDIERMNKQIEQQMRGQLGPNWRTRSLITPGQGQAAVSITAERKTEERLDRLEQQLNRIEELLKAQRQPKTDEKR
jgi:hypothetical protein